MIPFWILATAMLAALILAVWFAVREFRRLDSAENSAENSLGIDSESVKKPEAPAGSGGDEQVELDGQVWGSS